MPFKNGSVKVDMADLESLKENLANYLLKHFKLNSSLIQQGLELNNDDVCSHELARMVNKFVYSKKLNSTHWVAVANNVVKINRFSHKNKAKKNKKPVTASTIRHGW